MSFTNRIIAAILCVIAAITLYALAPEFRDQGFSLYVSLLSVVCLYMNVKFAMRGLWSASSIFIIIFWCFHFGIILANAAGLNIVELTGNNVIWEWINSAFYTKAEALAVLGISVYSFVTVAKSGGELEDDDDDELVPAKEAEPVNYSVLYKLSNILLFAGIGGWLYIMLSMGGIAALFSGYTFYLKFIENYPIISIVYWSIGVGFTLLGILGSIKSIRPAFITFCVWGTIAFIMGLRGEVLYPTCGFLIAFSRRVVLPWRPRFFIIPLVLLSMISFVRDYRIDGIVKAENLNPIYGLLEMGGSLQTVVITQEWVATGIDYFRYGETIAAPFLRLTDRITGAQRAEGVSDLRLMNVAISERNGPYGFSPIAEGFINLGAVGVMAIMMLLSLFLNIFDTRPVSIVADSYWAGITYILLTFIRNAFAHIPGQSLLLVVTLTIVYAFFKRKIS